jgi:hypothetical protein
MNLTVFKKRNVKDITKFGSEWHISDKAVHILETHIGIVWGARTDVQKQVRYFVQLLICENHAFPMDKDIEEELSEFFGAIHSGAVKVRDKNAMAYANEYRRWKFASYKKADVVDVEATAAKGMSLIAQERSTKYPDYLFHNDGEVFSHAECADLIEISGNVAWAQGSEFIAKAQKTLDMHERRGTVGGRVFTLAE